MKTKMDYSSLGEQKGTHANTPSTHSKISHEVSGHATHSSVRGMKQRNKSSSSASGADRSGTMGVAMGLLAGAGVGMLAGILMAPDSGRTTRRRLSDSAAWVGRGISESFSSNKGKMGSWIGKADKTISHAADSARDAVSGTQKNY